MPQPSDISRRGTLSRRRLLARTAPAAVLSLLPSLLPEQVLAQEVTDAEFRNPPPAARPHTWWHWMNGNISEEGITADLEAMARVGIGGAQIFNVDQGIPAGKVPFMSDEWRRAVVHAAKEAKRLGLELCLHNCAGWSSSGGPWIDAPHSMQILTSSETTVSGGTVFTGKLPEPPKKAGYYRDISVLAFRKPINDSYRIPSIQTKALFSRGGAGIGQIGDASGALIPMTDVKMLECAADGSLSWKAPSGGDWILLRIGHTSTGKTNHPAPAAGRGLECDKLSREAMNLHWEKGIAPILAAMGPELVGKSLNNSLIDSFEVGTQNWTPAFRTEFQRRRGYDPVPYLPVVTGRVIESAEIAERFLWDLRRTASDLYAENYAGRFKELCHENGLLFSVEPYGDGSFDELQIGAMADIPMGEFWVNGAAAGTIKVAASSAHVTGRKIVGAESFTASENDGRWLVEPYGVKALGDRMYTEGLNRCIFHRYAHQPWLNLRPGMTMGPWGMHLERTITWWEQSRSWLTYLARCQHLLQQGRFVADVLTYSGDDAPGSLLRPNLPPGFDYDGCDRSILMTARVENGEVVLPGGARYRVLHLPNSLWMTPETVAKLVSLSKAGAVIVGPPPEKSPSLTNYPACDTSVKQGGESLTLTPPERLASVLGKPDVIVPKGAPLLWIHRRTADGADIYFVSNQRYANVAATLSFRVTGKQPELWRGETGSIEPAAVWNAEPGRTSVPLRLGPAESVFVVFRRPAPEANHPVSLSRTGISGQNARSPVVRIEQARYEAIDGTGGSDVTEKVRDMAASGEYEIRAENELFGDPTLNHAKRLRVIYTLDGKRRETSVRENQSLNLLGANRDGELPEYDLKADTLLAYEEGNYTVSTSDRKSRRISVAAMVEQPISGPWTVTFPPKLGAPPSVTLPKLISWTEHKDPGVRYFSGTALYRARFTVARKKGHALILDLGRVKNFAEVRINEKPLPTLWKAPWRIDVTDLVSEGENSLAVRVTNLWVNRLIGDEQMPAEVDWSGPTGPIKSWPQWLLDGKPRPPSDRIAFTTWRFWTKDDKPLESGLLGPVRLLHVPVVPLK